VFGVTKKFELDNLLNVGTIGRFFGMTDSTRKD